MRTIDKILVSSIIIVIFGFLISLISKALTPFIIGAIIAYLLDPLVDKMEARKCPRGIASIIIIFTFFATLITILFIFCPLLYQQIEAFSGKLPTYIVKLNEQFYPYILSLSDKLGLSMDAESLKKYILLNSEKIAGMSAKFAGGVIMSSKSIIGVVSLILITPIVSFYLIKDWDGILRKINSYLPKEYAEDIRRQAKAIDNTLSGYIRGQVSVCLILGIFYGLGLTILGLDFGLFIGLATGLLAFIPFVGMLSGATIAVLIATFQWHDFSHIGIVLGIFAAGQFIEGNFITPKLIGDKVGLHPIWIIFGLFSFGTLLGFVGVLMAVPLTAIIGVLTRFGIEKYKEKFVELD